MHFFERVVGYEYGRERWGMCTVFEEIGQVETHAEGSEIPVQRRVPGWRPGQWKLSADREGSILCRRSPHADPLDITQALPDAALEALVRGRFARLKCTVKNVVERVEPSLDLSRHAREHTKAAARHGLTVPLDVEPEGKREPSDHDQGDDSEEELRPAGPSRDREALPHRTGL